MIKRVIRERDFLFFYQIMLPLCDTSLSGIREDTWISYYSEVERWSNLYAYQIGLGGSYGNGFKHGKLPDFFSIMGAL